jgi:hypothetical protein
MRKMMKQVLRAEIGHNFLKNGKNSQQYFYALLKNLLGTLTSQPHILRSRNQNITQEDSLERKDDEYYI